MVLEGNRNKSIYHGLYNALLLLLVLLVYASIPYVVIIIIGMPTPKAVAGTHVRWVGVVKTESYI